MQCKVGKHTYLYESVSYRDENGEPRNKRKPIGKMDPSTGLPVYKPEYLERLPAESLMKGIARVTETFTTEDICKSTIKDYGAFYLFQEMAERMGLLAAMQKVFPGCWEEIFNLAAYLISTGDPFAYCEDWLATTEAFAVGPMTSQRISELMASITKEERDGFYQAWCATRSEREYLALDITSTSSYSELVDSVGWGYNRDGENLPQINICLLMGYKSRYPIYQSVYAGSIKDVTTLKTTIGTFRALAGRKPMVAVMDKGFYSARNVGEMLSGKQRVDFVVAVPFTNGFAKSLVESERRGIDTLSNTIVSGGGSMRAVTKVRKWDSKHKVFAHAYYNARKAQGIREDLYAHVATLRERAMKEPDKCAGKAEYEKYLIIRRSENTDTGYTVSLREDAVEAQMETAGWLVVISNFISDAKEAIKIYHDKDIVEKGFNRLKNSLDMGRIRVHSETSMQNKVFVGFIALILLSGIHNVMVDKKIYGKMTMKKLIMVLSRLKLQIVNGSRILFPVTKEQRFIYESFDICVPV